MNLNRKWVNEEGVKLTTAVMQNNKELAWDIVEANTPWSRGMIILRVNQNWLDWRRDLLLLPWQKEAGLG